MALIELHHEPFVSILHDPGTARLHAHWRGALTLASVQHGCELLLEAMVARKVGAILNLNIDVLSIEPRAAEWSAMEWFPRMKQAGLQYFAWVYGPTRLMHFSNATKMSLEDAEQLGVGIFFDTAQALAWLDAKLAPAQGEQRPLVLVVEDNRDFSRLFRDMLQIMGCDAHVAGDGPEALAFVARSRPDLIFCDIGLPGDMDGLALARALLRQPGLDKLPLIAVSGSATEADRDSALNAGFRRLLAKPIKFAEVNDTLAAFSILKHCEYRPLRA